uniref:Uncharacterized protein n=1 Tax=Vibrio sp. 04Ya090 TaxID=397884 RepID=W6JNZ9_9VIBR|nr:hypothetical protein [Vibrio sp. 04Ya090]
MYKLYCAKTLACGDKKVLPQVAYFTTSQSGWFSAKVLRIIPLGIIDLWVYNPTGFLWVKQHVLVKQYKF